MVNTFRFVDTAFGGVQHRNNVITLEQLRKADYNGKLDCYSTYFVFPESYAEHAKIQGTVKGYSGPVWAPYLPFDIDNEDLAVAHTQVKALIADLAINWDCDGRWLRYYFSGSKGFHVMIPSALFGGFNVSEHLPQVFRSIADKLGGDLIDHSIYDINRLFRLPNSKHSKSELFKIPLTYQELIEWDIEKIKETAISPRRVDFMPTDELTAIDGFVELYKKAIREAMTEKDMTVDITPVGNTVKAPRDRKPCIYALLNGVSEQRNNAGLRIAAHFRKEGFTEDLTTGILMAWNRRNAAPLDDDELKQLISSAYRDRGYDFGCNDPTLKAHCSSHCKYRDSGGVDTEQVYDSDKAVSAYEEYIRLLKEVKFVTGIEEIDWAIRGVGPGEVLTIIARPGAYKTAFLQTMLMNHALTSKNLAVFFSMEMPIYSIVERYMTMITQQEGREIERMFSLKETSAQAIREAFTRQLEKVIFVTEPSMTLEKVIAYVKHIEEQTGNLVGVVGIDYLQLMDAQTRGGEYDDTTALARAYKNIARTLMKPVVILSQTSRKGGSGYDEVEMDMGRGSGAIEEAADFLFGMWKPHFLKILKNRKGREHTYWRLMITPEYISIGGHADQISRETCTAESRQFKEARRGL